MFLNRFVVVVFSMCLCFGAFANTSQTSDDFFHTFDTIEDMFYQSSSVWLLNSESYARKYLLLFIVIDFIVLGMKHVLGVESLKEAFNAVIWKILLVGGVLSLIQELPILTDKTTGFFSGFEVLGSKITGVQSLSPTGIVDTGIAVVNMFIQHVANLSLISFFEGSTYVISIFIILGCFCCVALVVLMTKIQAYILMFGGCFFLCLAGSKFTQMYAWGYLKYCLTTGIKLFIAYLVAAVGVNIASIISQKLAADPLATGDLNTLLVCNVIFVFYAALSLKISEFANGFLTGLNGANSSDVLGTAASMVSTTAAIATGGKTAAAGSLAGMIGGLGKGLGAAAGKAAFKGAGHAHAAVKSLGSNFNQNTQSGLPIEVAAPKAVAQTAGNAAKNMAKSVGDFIQDTSKNAYKSHNKNVRKSPFYPPSKKQ